MPFEPIYTDVSFLVNTGRFRADMAQIEADYSATTGAMTDDTIRLALAQDKLNRALQFGPESSQAARATLGLRQVQQGILAEQQRQAQLAATSTTRALNTIQAPARMVGRALTTYITVPTIAIGYEATKMAITFQRQMLLIQTQAGASAGEVQRMSKAVLELARVTPEGPVQLAQALYHLESVGLRGAAALDALHTSAMAAGMGIADIETVTTALGAAMVTGIRGAQSADQAMGFLNATVGAGNMRMQDLADALSTEILPKAKNAGVALDEVGAALATLTDRGVGAEKAATQLGTTFALIMAPSHPAVKALADMGIGAHQLRDELAQPNGLLKALDTLRAGMERVGKERGATDILEAFGRSRQSGAILTLVESLTNKLSGYETKLKQVDSTQGNYLNDVATYQHSAAYKLARDWSEVQADLIKFGNTFEPVATTVVGAITSIVDGLDKLPHFAKTDLAIVIGALAVGGPLLLAIAAVIRAVNTISTTFRSIPVAAGKAVAETDAELTLLQTSATTTADKVALLAGTEGGTTGIAGVGTAATNAETKVGGLTKSLGLLSALTLAPIVIPIIYQGETYILKKIPIPGVGNAYKGLYDLVENAHKGLYDLGGMAANNMNGGPGGPGNANRSLLDAALTAAEQIIENNPDMPDYMVGGLLASSYHGKFANMGYDELMATVRIARNEANAGSSPAARARAAAVAAASLARLESKNAAPGKPGAGGKPSTPSAPATYKPSRLAEINLELAKNPDSVKAIEDKLRYDEEAIAFAEKEIASGKLTPARGAAVMQELQQLYADEHQLQNQLSSIAAKAAEKEKQRAEAAKKAKEAIQKKRLERVKQLEQAPVKLQTEVANAIANNASDQKLLTLYREERKALDEQLKELDAMNASAEQKLKNRQAAAAIEKKIDAITHHKGGSTDAQAFLNELSGAITEYAPNVNHRGANGQLLPGSGGNVVFQRNEFLQALEDPHAAAKFARQAMQGMWG